MSLVRKKNPNELEFQQAVEEVIDSVAQVLDKHPEYRKLKIFERLIEPERIITFRVCWADDSGTVQINRGYRVQMSSTIGPYKGGLTGLPLGGGKGGSDFNPRGKSDGEIMRFCQSFMTELYRHIGDFTDVPAGDIGVGQREIGYMFGMYKKIKNEFTGMITGKGEYWGGSAIRPEATGYGLIYFASSMLATRGDTLKGKTCLISGSGNVAQFAIEKILDEGGIPISVSDSDGFIID